MAEPLEIAPATGRLGILTPGMGAVASTAYAGGSVTYTLELTNGGPNPTGAIVVSDPLPSGLTYFSSSGSGSYDDSSGEWSLVTVAPGSTVTLEVEDKAGKIAELAERYSDGEIDYLDGITVAYPDWWFNVRKSNTEPLLRLNLEGMTEAAYEDGRWAEAWDATAGQFAETPEPPAVDRY